MAVRPDATTKSSTPPPAKTEEDLEQYGVWVKAEPQDILEEPEDLPLGTAEFDLPSESPLPGADSFLTDDEEKLLGSFDELDTPRNEASVDLQDIENLPPLQDFEVAESTEESPMDTEIEELGGSTFDISLDDLDSNTESLAAFDPKAKFDPDAAPKAGKPAKASVEAAQPQGSEDGMEDVSSEFLDFEESGSPAAVTDDVTSEFLGGDEAPAAKAETRGPEPAFEAIDMDLSFDESAAGSSEEPGFESVSDFDDLLVEEAPTANPVDAGFDDLGAVERDLAEPSVTRAPAHAPATAAPASTEPSLANELLLKIADELSSIRSELVTLKSQFGALKPEARTEAPPAEEEPQASAGGGFFDDEEDETIALTGDELDNIVNTADFIEENADEGQAEASASEELLLDESLLPESGDYPVLHEDVAEVPAIEEVNLEANDESALSLPVEEEEIAAFDLEEGAQPLTQAPEDTSYLEEPLPDEEPLELAEIPLHEESLADEGSASLELESEDLEPLEEIAEELPVVEGTQASPLADLTLDLEADSSFLMEEAPAAEPVEILPEIEDIGFGELSLAEESPLAEEGPEELVELTDGEEDLSPIDSAFMEEEDLEAKLAEKTVKPSQPVNLHPDEIPMSLDDSFFVGGPSKKAEALEIEDIEEVVPEASPRLEAAEAAPIPPAPVSPPATDDVDRLKSEIKGVLSYLDKLLESLPESKIEEFARSEHFDVYKRLFEDLGLV